MKLSEFKKEMDRIADQFDVDADDIYLNIDNIKSNVKGIDQHSVIYIDINKQEKRK